MNPWLAIAVALAAFGGWFVAGNLLAKLEAVSSELARKFVHVGMGLTCLSFPWLFSETWPVLVLGGVCLAGLLAVKLVPAAREKVGGCLHNVERQSLGEVYFAVGIALLFWWSGGDRLLFCVPTLILTIADATGALIGVRYGKISYATLTGEKSAEGSAMFFLAAFMSAHVPLLLFSDIGRAEVLLISLTLAAMVMLVEAITTGGLDNLLIPLGGFYLLTEYMKMDTATLVGRFVLVTILLVVVLTLSKHSSLDGGALLGAALFGYGCFALGGWPCFVVVLIVFIAHLHATRAIAKHVEESHSLSAIISIAATGMTWLVLRRDDPVAPFTLGIVTHFAILNFNTVEFLHQKPGHAVMLARSTAKAVLLCYPPLILFLAPRWEAAAQAGLAVPVAIAATWLFSLIYPARPKVSPSAGRWFTQAVIATAASAAALLI